VGEQTAATLGNGNKGGREQGPPDLDDIFRKLSKKLGGLGGGKGGLGGGNSAQGLADRWAGVLSASLPRQ
jgi:membrane protease subunit HflK